MKMWLSRLFLFNLLLFPLVCLGTSQTNSVSQEAPQQTAPTQDAAPTSATAQTPAQGGTVMTKGPATTQTCVACHSTDGNSTVPNWPKIAGQHQNYIVKQLKEFRLGEKGPRFEPSMYSMTANLTDQDINELAAFYASQTQTLGTAQNEYVSLGERIYRGGNVQTGVTACAACHQPDGRGNEAAKFPRLSGQHATYLENQLHAFRDGKRKNSPNGMMEDIAKRMTEQEIKAVSSYIEGLRGAQDKSTADEKKSD